MCTVNNAEGDSAVSVASAAYVECLGCDVVLQAEG